MVSPSGRFVLAFNGEVYNYRDLRAELAAEGFSFQGSSDSEVVLAALEGWGIPEALTRFNGMFAIALWDIEGRAVHLIRDRMGIKPLYYAMVGPRMLFGSELRVLRPAPEKFAAIDRTATFDYAAHLYFLGETTPLESARKLLPGHWITFQTNHLGLEAPPEPRRWWSEPNRRIKPDHERDPETATRELERLVSDAVRIRMVADVPIGALLSGGTDSTLIAAMMQEHSPTPIKTFTIGFDDAVHDESTHARAISEYLGTDHTELTVTGKDALNVVPKLPGLLDEPLADPSLLPTYLVSALARQKVTVALSGDGGDELFAGYTRHVIGSRMLPPLAQIPPSVRRPLARLLQFIPTDRWDALPELLTSRDSPTRLLGQKVKKLTQLLHEPTSQAMYLRLLMAGNRDEELVIGGTKGLNGSSIEGLAPCDSLSEMLAFDQAYYLPGDLLQKVDRASMAHSLEVRVPLLDHRIVEWSWSVPSDQKIRGGGGKWLLKEVLARRIPRSLTDRPKTGFTVPLASWLSGPLNEWAEDLLFSAEASRDSIFDPQSVRTQYDQFMSGDISQALSLWAVLMFEAWRREWNIG